MTESKLENPYLNENFVGNAEMEEQEESVNGYTNEETVPITSFYRTHFVEVNHDRVIMCSCCGYQSSGIFCVHQLSVAKFIYDTADI